MKKFPDEFADLLTPRGLRILKGADAAACSRFRDPRNYFVTLGGVVVRERAAACMRLLDGRLYDLMTPHQRKIPRESIEGMETAYSETLGKTIRFKTAFLRRKRARAYRAAEEIGLLRMMRSESFAAFAEAVTGFQLGRDQSLQVICYGHGDYVGPHNDHHPDVESIKDGFVDFHVMFVNDAVAHHYLVYEEDGHLSKMVDANVQGGVSIYKLPFWHYTTPLWGKPRREAEARRWLLLGSFEIVGG
jgi:hypothetical protein